MLGVVGGDAGTLGELPGVLACVNGELDFVALARGDRAVGPTGGLEPSTALDLDLQVTLTRVADLEYKVDCLAAPDRLSGDL